MPGSTVYWIFVFVGSWICPQTGCFQLGEGGWQVCSRLAPPLIGVPFAILLSSTLQTTFNYNACNIKLNAFRQELNAGHILCLQQV